MEHRTRVGRVGWIVLVSLLATLGLPGGAIEAGTLWLHVVDEEGEAIPQATARLLPFRWRKSNLEPIPAEVVGPWLKVPVDPWQWQQETGVEGVVARLEIEAEGFALIRSDVIAKTPPEAKTSAFWEIRLPGCEGIIVPQSGDTEKRVALRPAGERTLRFVEQDGRPAVGVPVTVHVHGNTANACALLRQNRRLVEGETDNEGTLVVPDVDASLVIELGTDHHAPEDRPRWSMAEPGNPMLPARKIVEPEALERAIAVHRWQPRRLRIEVRRRGAPVAGAQIGATVPGPCGARGGPIGLADDSGVFEENDAFRERYTELFVYDETDGVVWQIDTRDLPSSGVVRVDLEG